MVQNTLFKINSIEVKNKICFTDYYRVRGKAS